MARGGGDRRPGLAGTRTRRPRGKAGCISARAALAPTSRPRPPRRLRAPARWRLRSRARLSGAGESHGGAGRRSEPEPQDSGDWRAAPAAKVGFLSLGRFLRASAVGVGSAAVAEPRARSAHRTREVGAATRVVA